MTGFTEGDLDGNTNAGSNELIVVKYNSSGVSSGQSNSGLLVMIRGGASPVTPVEMSM